MPTTKKYKFTLGRGSEMHDLEEVIEVPFDTTDDEVQEMFENWLSNYIDAGYERVYDE